MSGCIYLEKKISDGLVRALIEDAFSIEYSGAYSRFNEIKNSSKFIVVTGEHSADGTTSFITTSAGVSMDGGMFQIFITTNNNTMVAMVSKENPDIIHFSRLD